MDGLQALLLGLIQGLTEFFPISSSAHLKVLKSFFGIEQETTLFDLFCHMGTFLALLVYFRQMVFDLFRTPRKLLLIVVALAPLIPFYFLLKPLREAASKPEFLGFCMMATAGILFLASKLAFKARNPLTLKDAWWIGVIQGVALIPGISRSGATIGAGLLRGVSTVEAVRFSFLLSLPAIGGGTCLELIKVRSHLATMPISLPHCWIGFIAAAIAGFVMVRIAIPLLEKGVLRPFAWYCLIAGVVVTLVYG